MRTTRSRIASRVALTALIAAMSSHAAAAADQTAGPAQPAGPAALPDETALGDIVVTANKRSENLQRTPAAITALAGPMLVSAGVTDIRAAQNFIPSVRFQAQSTATEIYIRGVGSSLDYPHIDPPTGMNFNGIYIPREATSVGLYDVSQIEVLPGPQGTLYGRSSLGGIVNVNFNRPTHQLETHGLVEAGNYSAFHVSGAENVPLSSTLAVRIAGDYNYHHGYLKSGADSADDYGVRLSLLYTPTDRLSVYVWGATADLNGAPNTAIAVGIDPKTGDVSPGTYLNKSPWNDQIPAPYSSALPFGQPDRQSYDYKNNIVSGELTYDLSDGVTLTYVPSYLDFHLSNRYWLGIFPANKIDRYEQTTHELRLSGKPGWGSWLFGLYGYRLTSGGIFTFGGFTPATGFPVTIVDRSRIKGVAAFGQAVIDVTDRLRVTAGGRYSIDDRVGRGRFFSGAALAPYTYSHVFRHADFKLGLDYDLAPAVLAYAAIQTGFLPGSFNTFASTPAASNAIGSSKLTGYTAGIKSRVLDGMLQLNSELFYYDYSDLIASAYNIVLNTNQSFNAKKVEIYGNQTDILFAPSADDRLNLSVGYLHARNKRFTLPDGSANFDGLQLQNAPDWTVSAGYHHDFQLSGGYVRAAVNSRYESSFFPDFNHTPGGRQKPYTKTDASLTYYRDGNHWSLGAWIKNIENEPVIAAAAGGNFISPLGATAFIEPPRTYGLRGTFNF